MTWEELHDDLREEREEKPAISLEEMFKSFAQSAAARGYNDASLVFLRQAEQFKAEQVQRKQMPAPNPNDKPFSFQAIEDQYQKEKREGIQDVEQFIALLEEGQALDNRIAELVKAREELIKRQDRRAEVNKLLTSYLKRLDIETTGNTGWDNRMLSFLHTMYEKMKKHLKDDIL